MANTLFYFFLLAYKSRIEAYMQRSVLRGISASRLRERERERKNTPSWKEARELACQAWTLAMDAAAARDHAANENG